VNPFSRDRLKIRQILALSDCNFIWFAQIFKDLLLFHGTNLPKDSDESYGTRSSPHPNNSQYRQLEERLGPGGGGTQGIHSLNMNRQRTQLNEKHGLSHLLSTLKDPSALFPGYQQFFFKFILIMDSAKLNHYLSDILIEEILTLTDVLSLGEYRQFVQELKSGDWATDSLSQQMFNLTEIQKIGISTSSQRRFTSLKSALLSQCDGEARGDGVEIPKKHLSFNIRILQLRILGKFLGLLHSYPYWTLSLCGGSNLTNSAPLDSPLVEMINRSATLRSNMSFESISTLPISRLLYLSWQDSTLTLAVSWIVNYFRMMAWDNSSILHHGHDPTSVLKNLMTVKSEHITAMAVLTSIISSPEYRLSCVSLSRNRSVTHSLSCFSWCSSSCRLYVFLEIQSFFAEFPSLQRLQPLFLSLINPPPPRSVDTSLQKNPIREVLPLSLDEGEAAFTEIFTKHVIPSLYDLYIHLQQRKGWAHQYLLKKKTQTTRSQLVDQTMIPKRLTPTPSIILPPSSIIIPSQGQTSEISSPPSAAISFIPPSRPSQLTSSADPPIAARLEAAFWQAYPYLQQLTQNFIQHLTSSCQKKLKEKVVDMIVAAWELCDMIKKDSISRSVEEFEIILNESLTTLFSSTHTEIKNYLQQFLLKHFQQTFIFQLEMYSLSQGVQSILIQLANTQQQQLMINNLNYFTSYANKKLNEVKIVCHQQRIRMEVLVAKNQMIENEQEEIHKSSQGIMKQCSSNSDVLASDSESLHAGLLALLEKFFPSQPIAQRSFRRMFHIQLLSAESKSLPSSGNSILPILMTQLCDLFLYPLEELIPTLTTSAPAHQNQLHILCETICRFLIGLVSVVNKYLLFYTSSSDQSPDHRQLLGHICFMIVNITQFISTLQSWCQTILHSTSISSTNLISFSSSTQPTQEPASQSISPESIGRIKIEFNKMYLEIQHSLLFYTSFLQEHSCLIQPTLPSSHLILEAYDARLITIRAINRLLSSTLKSKPPIHIPSFPIEQSVLGLIQKFLQRFHSDLIGLQNKSPSFLCIFI
jgi:hypothetical protein